jgi:autotransporter-associated beta strand protein
LTKAGAGTLNLAGPNTFAGPIYLNAGTIQIGTDSTGSVGHILNSPLGMDSVIISGGTITSDGSTARTVINPVTFAGDAALGAASTYTGVLTFQAPGTLTGNRTLTVNSAVSYAGTLGDGGLGFGLNKAGTSKLTLSGINSYAGTTTVSAGSLQATTTAALPGFDASGKISVNTGATLIVNYGSQGDWTSTEVDTLRSNAAFASGSLLGFDTANAAAGASYGSDISGGMALNKLGSNTLTLSGANSHTGGTTLTAGLLNIDSAQALGTGTFIIAGVGTIDNTTSAAITLSTNNTQTWNANFTFAGTQDLNLGSGPVTLGGDKTVTVGDRTLTVGGVIGGAYSLIKAGSGTLALGGANTYTGTTLLNAGTLFLQNQYALQNSTFSGVAGMLVFDAAVSGHAFTFGGLSGSFNLDLRDTSANAVALTVGNSNSNTYSGVISGSGSLTKIGAGMLTLSDANTFSGKTTVNAGTLSINSESSLGSAPGSFTPDQLLLNGGILQTNATFSIGANRGITLGTSGGSLRPNGGTTVTVASVIDGPGSLTNAGPGAVTLSGLNTYAGGTILSGGQLNINNPSALGSGALTIASSCAIDNTSGSPMVLANHSMAWNGNFKFLGTQNLDLGAGPVTLGGNRQVTVTANTLAIGGAIGGNYSLSKFGNGTLVLSGINTYTGTTNIVVGALVVNGSLGGGPVVLNGGNCSLGGSGSIGGDVTAYSGSTISPGDGIGMLTLSGKLTLNGGSRLNFDLATPGSSDQIAMPSSSLLLNGQQFSDFTFSPQTNFTPGTYSLITARSIQGSLGSSVSGTVNGFGASISTSGGNLLLTVVPEPSSVVLVGIAIIGSFAYAWRRKKHKK